MAKPDAIPSAPRHLSPAMKRWWRDVVSTFELESHDQRLLQSACEAWDRGQEARALIERDGLVVATANGGMKRHPAVAIEHECRIGFARLLRELALGVEPPAEAARPPMLRSVRRRGGFDAA